MVQGVFFDIRALVFGPQGAELLAEILRTEGVEVTPDEVADASARLPQELLSARTSLRTEEDENDFNRAMLPALLTNLGMGTPTDALLLRLVESVHQYNAYLSMYPETLPVLEELKRREMKLAVIANWEPSLRRLIREFELEGYFAAIIPSMEVGLSKPDPFIFQRGLKAVELKADQVLHVGPSLEQDVTGAIRAGLRPVWLNRTGIPTGHEVLTITDLRGLLLLTQAGG